ncbi:desulfoferrodoxin FeS4 iron-binding domain-containing protein [bacterium]|nr:desulfoferrodoxin FeS4 iron-binding domain-containing protein [bacterium]
MTERLEFYRCKICGNLIQVILDGAGELVCCGENMEKLTANTQEKVNGEYHIPVYVKDDNGFTSIQVGKELHPMTEEHHIEFIERISEDKTKIQLEYMHTDKEPRMELQNTAGRECAVEFCNIHGLWGGHND